MHSGIFVDCISPERKKSIFRFGRKQVDVGNARRDQPDQRLLVLLLRRAVQFGPQVTLKTTNLTIRQTLDKLFEGSENTAIDGQQVFIRRAPAKKQQAPKSETITGWVLDKNNAPVSGATVIVAGTNKGVTSGIQGSSARRHHVPATLNISFLGYEPRTVVVTPQNKDQLTVVLNEESNWWTISWWSATRPSAAAWCRAPSARWWSTRTTSVRWPAPDSCSKACGRRYFRRDRETSARANV